MTPQLASVDEYEVRKAALTETCASVYDCSDDICQTLVEFYGNVRSHCGLCNFATDFDLSAGCEPIRVAAERGESADGRPDVTVTATHIERVKAKPRGMQLFVKTLTGTTYTINVCMISCMHCTLHYHADLMIFGEFFCFLSIIILPFHWLYRLVHH